MRTRTTRSIWLFLIFVNLFWLGLNIRNNAIGSLFMPYQVERFVAPEIRNTALGAMRTAGLVIAMLVQPAIGILSDRSTSRFGRRRPFLLMGVILDILLLVWIATAGSYWSLLAAVMLIQISSNMSHGPLQSLIPDLVPNELRGSASAMKAIFELLPIVLLGVTIAPLVGAGHFGWAVFATGAALLVILLVTLLTVKEQPITVPDRTPIKPSIIRVLGMIGGIFGGAISGLIVGAVVGGLVGLIFWGLFDSTVAKMAGIATGGVIAMVVTILGGTWSGIHLTLGNTHHPTTGFRWWVTNRFMFLAAVTSLQSFLPFFLMYSFKVSSEKSIEISGFLFTLVGIFTLASALPAGWLSDRFGQRFLVALSGLLGGLGTLIVLFTVWQPTMLLIYVGGSILGLGTGLFVTINWAMGTRLVPQEESGHWLGVSNLAGAGAGMIGTGIGGPLVDVLNAASPGFGYLTIFIAYALLFFLSIVCLKWIPGIKRDVPEIPGLTP